MLLVMRKISSTYTFFWKRVFPVLWSGLLVFFLVEALQSGALLEGMFVISIMGATGLALYVIYEGLRDLADEVYDCGDFLLIKKRREEERVALSDIRYVEFSTFGTLLRIPLISLKLFHSTPGKFGNEIAFVPPLLFRLNPFAKDQVAVDLTARVDAARSKRAV